MCHAPPPHSTHSDRHCWRQECAGDGRASLSAPESQTRGHERTTSQVRVSGTERDTIFKLSALQSSDLLRETAQRDLPPLEHVSEHVSISQRGEEARQLADITLSLQPVVHAGRSLCRRRALDIQQVQTSARHNTDQPPPPTLSVSLTPSPIKAEQYSS